MTSMPALYPVENPTAPPLIEMHDAQTEAMTLGCMLLAPSAVAEAMDIVSADDFYSPAYQEVFAVLVDFYAHGKPLEPVAVHRALPAPTRSSVSVSDLFALSHQAVSPSSAAYYATRVKKLAELRAISSRLYTALARAHKEADPYDLASSTISDLTMALDRDTDHYATAADVVQEALVHSAARADGSITDSLLTTGWSDLDHVLGGIRAGQLVLCAGRPGTGKSVAALDIARHLAIHSNIPVLFFSLEMSALEIGQRITAAEAGVPLAKIINGGMTDEEWHRAQAAQQRMEGAPLHLDTTANLTTATIRARTHQMMLTHGIRLVIIDYLGLLRHPRENKLESRQVAVSEISRDLKVLAKELVPVVALAQLNRGVESRHDKRPLLSDLRDTGALEQDGDVVLLLHRDDVYDPDSPRAGEVDVIVAKHRNGPTACITLANQYHMARLTNLF